ncbi:XVIPCD domain-containing protein [Xanthomonas sontii]|uniref:XVIPCD domain-containing protein n=1 Tax=Xanthomonas sontii TaxID=2650745 RepID=UPI003F82630A
MPSYAIEARSLGVIGIAGHAFWVLRDEHGKAVAELHGLATDRQTGQAIPIGTDEARHSLRAWHYPHDPAYARSIGEEVDSTTYIRDDQPARTVATGDKHEILERWNTAVRAVPELNAQDHDYPNYGFKVFGETINSNSAYRTFGELMDVPVQRFPGRLEPGIGNRMLSPKRTEELRYHAPGEQKQQRAPAPAADPTRTDHPDHTLLQQIRDKVQGLNGPGQLKPADNDRVSASLYALAKQHHFSSVDQVALSQQTATAAAGETSSSCRGCQRSGQAACAHVKGVPHRRVQRLITRLDATSTQDSEVRTMLYPSLL